ncbi:MAG: hypothetical protein OXU77_14570 [Gammaproteobacteria bacterium]|nr:hypothetical protein [Gammaproteobacteria bacterium]
MSGVLGADFIVARGGWHRCTCLGVYAHVFLTWGFRERTTVSRLPSGSRPGELHEGGKERLPCMSGASGRLGVASDNRAVARTGGDPRKARTIPSQ